MLRLALASAPTLLLSIACCFGGAAPSATVEARGSVRDIHGEPIPNAHVVLIANDYAACRDCTSAGTPVETTSAADGTFTVTNSHFNPQGYQGIVQVSRDDHILVSHDFPAPDFGTAPTIVEVTLYVDDRVDHGPLDATPGTFDRDPGFHFVRDDAAMAFVLCTPRPLHACFAHRGEGRAERRWLAFDVDATSSCETLVADARARCGAGTDDATLACLARAGLFLDALAIPVVPSPDAASGGIGVLCDEGHASNDPS